MHVPVFLVSVFKPKSQIFYPFQNSSLSDIYHDKDRIFSLNVTEMDISFAPDQIER